MCGVRLLLSAFVLLFFGASAAFGQAPSKAEKMARLKMMAPAKGYVKAHKGVKEPFTLLGGPIEVGIQQPSGGVFVALPAQRTLDMYVFGTPQMPRSFAGTPGVNGLPPMARATADGAYTKAKPKSPFGDNYTVMPGGTLKLQATDATATDAAVTDDKVQMMAEWKDKQGNTYAVRCCKMLATHGMEFPTFGGVVTNHILHGFTRIGTAQMPSEYTYFAFWGMGEVIKNGEVIDKPRLVHGMLTEYVRGENYKLVTDENVGPTRRHFHLMVAPFMPDPKNLSFKKSPVNTGFTMKNGMKLPFWHVMFENLTINGQRQ